MLSTYAKKTAGLVVGCYNLYTCAKKKAGLVVGCYLYYKGKSWNCSGIVKVLLNLIIVCN